MEFNSNNMGISWYARDKRVRKEPLGIGEFYDRTKHEKAKPI